MMLVAVGLTVVQMGINLAGVAIASRINNIAAFTAELGLSIILTLILLIVGFVTHPVQSIGFLGTSSTGGSDFTIAFLLSGLLGIWVLTGQEGAADLAEETHLARRNVPRALLTSIIVSSVIGFFMIVALTINIPNLATVTSAPVPIIAVLESALGKSGALLFEIVAMVALFAGGLANMAASSRLIFSLSRDKMLPGSGTLSKVNASRTPSAAILVAATLSIIIVVVGTYIATSTMALVVGMASVGYYAVYGLTILAAILSTRRGALSGTSTFSLGSWATPIRWIAFIWTVLVVVELTVPTANQQTALMAGVFFLIAAAWYVLVLRGRINRHEAGTPQSSVGA
jgi:amino acid transporter